MTVDTREEAPGEQIPGCELSGWRRGGESRTREGLLPRLDRRSNRATLGTLVVSKIKDMVKEAADMSKGPVVKSAESRQNNSSGKMNHGKH